MDLELDTSTIMMIIFIVAFVISMWKIYAFLPNKQLAEGELNSTIVAFFE